MKRIWAGWAGPFWLGGRFRVFGRNWIGQGYQGEVGTPYVVRYKRQEAAGKLEQTHVRRYEVLGVIS